MKGVSSNLFNISNSNKSFSAEYSALEADNNFGSWAHGLTSISGRTMVVASEKTGATSVWNFSYSKKDDEGDLLYDIFVPSHETIRKFPKLNGYTMTIFND